MATSTIGFVNTKLDSQIIEYEITSTTNAQYIIFSYTLPDVEGYTPVGIVGFQTAADGSTPNNTRISSLYLTDNVVTGTVRRPGSTNATKTLLVQILYFKT